MSEDKTEKLIAAKEFLEKNPCKSATVWCDDHGLFQGTDCPKCILAEDVS
jgi:hypothetical protein